MENAKELIRIDQQTKERWQWIRIVSDDSHSLEKPNAQYVCEHLTRKKSERVIEELADIASEDPGELDCHYTIRLCDACADVYQANVDRRDQRITVKSNDELRGYLMGLEDGFVESKLQDDIEDKYTDMGEFDALHRQAHAFVDTKGKQFYGDFVETVNFNPDGTRSRGYCPQPGAKPRRKGYSGLGDCTEYTKDQLSRIWAAGVAYGEKHPDDATKTFDEEYTQACEEAISEIEREVR